jgi:hypothetical protein
MRTGVEPGEGFEKEVEGISIQQLSSNLNKFWVKL